MLNLSHPHFRAMTERQLAEAAILAEIARDPSEFNAFLRDAMLPTFDADRVDFRDCGDWTDVGEFPYAVGMN